MDIKPPPKRKPTPPVQLPTPAVVPSVDVEPPRRQGITRKQLWTLVLTCLGVLVLIVGITATAWYSWAISPRSSEDDKVRIVVEAGDTATSIASDLYEHDLIRSRAAFNLYAQLSGNRSKLQAGGYVLSPNQSVSSIVEHMVSGKTDEFNVTILPGLTLDKLRERFKKDGFSDAEITAAFNADYNHPLLATRPAGATLEGYIYPDTYRMNADQTLEVLFERVFDHMYETMQDKKYLDEYAKRNLTIHQAVTLASIVQMEEADPADQKQVAQVFFKRQEIGMPLGSDVTFVYAAEQAGQTPTVSFDSPYNTRKYAGLPPGPIANMNPSALEAVAFPAPGDFLYFVAGDDGVTYFSRTEQEHNANVKAHCKHACSIY